jgi:hypothetical protein
LGLHRFFSSLSFGPDKGVIGRRTYRIRSVEIKCRMHGRTVIEMPVEQISFDAAIADGMVLLVERRQALLGVPACGARD